MPHLHEIKQSLLCMFVESLTEANLPDYRTGENISYHLPFFCFAVLLSELAQCQSQKEKVLWIEKHLQLLSQHWVTMSPVKPFETAPSQPTMSRLLSHIRSDRLIAGVLAHLRNKTLSETPDALQQVCLDGKARKGVISPESGRTEVDLTAFDAAKRLTLAVMTIPDKQGEASCVEPLLKELRPREQEFVFTADPGLTSRNNTDVITKHQCEYLFAIKGNAGRAFEFAQDVSWDEVVTQRTTVDTGHGRVTQRTLKRKAVRGLSLDEQSLFSEYSNLHSLLQLETWTQRGGKETRDVRYFIASQGLKKKSLRELSQLIQNHWSIENGLHWVKDVVLNEDNCATKSPISSRVLGFFRNLIVAMGHKLRGSLKTLSDEFRFFPERLMDELMDGS